MATTNYFAKVYETVLTVPGMQESLKIDLRLTRKNAFLLSKIIERGLAVNGEKDGSSGLLELIPAATLQEMAGVGEELLQKAGLTEMNEKLKSFNL